MSGFQRRPEGERFTIDRLAKHAPEAVAAARAALLALPVRNGVTSRPDKLKVLERLNAALAARGLDAVTYSMLNGWAADLRFRKG